MELKRTGDWYCATAYALLFLRSGSLPSARVLANTGISESQLRQRDYLDAHQLAIMMRNIDAVASNRAWAARVGAQIHVGAHGPLGFAALSAPTLGDAMQVMAEYLKARINSVEMQLELDDGWLHLKLANPTGDIQFGEWQAEIVLKVMEIFVETIMGHRSGDNLQINFARALPEHADDIAAVFNSPCHFGAPCNGILIPASWRHIPSPLHDEVTYHANLAKCRQLILAQTRIEDPVQQVRYILSSHFDEVLAGTTAAARPPDMTELAARLCITPRTLIRRLKKEETSYKSLLEQTRQECAQSLLAATHLSVADVSYKLGYRDPSNFSRAFRNWAGTSPASWRKRNKPLAG